jgi:hypothetical protein
MKDIETWLISNSPIRPWDLDQGFIPESSPEPTTDHRSQRRDR